MPDTPLTATEPTAPPPQALAVLPIATVPPEPVEDTLLGRFNQYFDLISASTPEQVRMAQEIRFQVYCVEHPFEKIEEHPDGLENDEFDAHSVHSLLVHRPTQRPMGTVRLVLALPEDPDNSFALQQVTDDPILTDRNRFPVMSTAEISRFSISKEFRRRKGDTMYGDPEVAEDEPFRRRSGPLMRLGLIQSIVQMTVENGITHWCAVMEPTLLRMLTATSIHFVPIGPMVNYHGVRQPCYCNVVDVLSRVQREQPGVWDILTDGGRLWQPLLDNQRRLEQAAE